MIMIIYILSLHTATWFGCGSRPWHPKRGLSSASPNMWQRAPHIRIVHTSLLIIIIVNLLIIIIIIIVSDYY